MNADNVTPIKPPKGPTLPEPPDDPCFEGICALERAQGVMGVLIAAADKRLFQEFEMPPGSLSRALSSVDNELETAHKYFKMVEDEDIARLDGR